MNQKWVIAGTGMALLLFMLFALPPAGAVLSCSVRTSNCPAGFVTLFRMNDTVNAHVQEPNATAYAQRVCCEDSEATLGTGCAGNYAVLLRMHNTTRSHVQQATQAEYGVGICLNSTRRLTCTYASSCAGYETCIASIGTSEARPRRVSSLHVGNCTAYETKICCGSDLAAQTQFRVTLQWEFNISGNGGDNADVDNQTIGYYRYDNSSLQNKYLCLRDENITNTPTYGMVFSGRDFFDINVTSGNSFVMKMTQYSNGNRFALPVTRDGCGVVRNKMSAITRFGTLTEPFVPFLTGSGRNPVEITLSYQGIDIIGDFAKTGSFTLLLEKNDSDVPQIIIREG